MKSSRIAIAPVIPHLELLIRELLNYILSLEEDLLWAFEGIARFYEGQGFYALAEYPRQRCLSSVQELLSDQHPHVATSLNNLAVLYESQGRYNEAEPLFVKTLALKQELLGKSHLHVASSLNNLAGLYESQGRHKEAELLYQRALSLRQELLGKSHPHVATSLHNLAGSYYSQGKYEEAELLYQQSPFTRNKTFYSIQEIEHLFAAVNFIFQDCDRQLTAVQENLAA